MQWQKRPCCSGHGSLQRKVTHQPSLIERTSSCSLPAGPWLAVVDHSTASFIMPIGRESASAWLSYVALSMIAGYV